MQLRKIYYNSSIIYFISRDIMPSDNQYMEWVLAEDRGAMLEETKKLPPTGQTRLLKEALKYNQRDIVFALLDENRLEKNDLDTIYHMGLRDLVTEHECVLLMQGLKERGMNLTEGHGMVFSVCFTDHPKMKNVEYIFNEITETDNRGVSLVFDNLVSDMARKKKEHVPAQTQRLFKLCLNNFSQILVAEKIEKLGHFKQEVVQELKTLVMQWNLERLLPTKDTTKKGFKV